MIVRRATHFRNKQSGRPAKLAPAFDQLVKGQVQAVIIPPNGMFINQRESIIQLALSAMLPTFFHQRQDIEAGGLLSYGA